MQVQEVAEQKGSWSDKVKDVHLPFVYCLSENTRSQKNEVAPS